MASKAVLFDLFGVLTCTTSPELKIIKRWKLDPRIHDALQRAVCGQKFHGWESYIGNIAKTAKIENSAANRDDIKEIVVSEAVRGERNVPEFAAKMLSVLRARGYSIALVSNSYPGCREIIEKNGLMKFFDGILLSYEVGMTKQNPKIYQIALKRLGVKAENAVMVGDSLKSDILSSRAATNGKISGILISKKPIPKAKAICTVVGSLAGVPKAINNFSKPNYNKKIFHRGLTPGLRRMPGKFNNTRRRI